MRYRLTFSRPGAAQPYAQAYQRAAGTYGPDEIVPLGGALEVLPGHFSGTGNITLNRAPQSRDGLTRCAPRDWVRVYLGADPDPVYLGEVASEPRVAGGSLTLTLAGLKDRVSKARWKSDVGSDGKALPFKARFRPYFQGVLGRAVLPPGVTVGPLPDLDVTLRAVTLSELIGDAFQQALGATQGGTWGVDALARVGVALPSDALTHRFVQRDSDRPAGDVAGYANCIRFGYRRPSGDEAFFEYRYGLGVAEFGESWLMDTLPSSVTTTLTNPYGTQALRVFQSMTYPGENASMSVTREVTLPAMDPAWTGHLSDGFPAWDTTVKSGALLTGLGPDHNGYTIKGAGSGGVGLSISELPGSLRLQIQDESGAVTTYAQQGPGQSSTWTLGTTVTGSPIYLRYHPADVATWRSQKGAYPPQFDLSISSATDQPVTVAVTQPVLSVMEPTDMRFVELSYGAPAVGGLLSVRAPAMNLPAQATLAVPRYTPWRGGDTITTNAAATGVSIQTLEGTFVALTRGDDEADTGRRVWVMPRDLSGGLVVVKGSPSALGWTGLNVTDEAGLLAYAVGRLLPLLTPVRSWVGRYPDLRRLTVAGVARFDDEAGDLDLNVTRGRYDLTNGRSVIEAGTPQAYDDLAAVEQAFAAIERVQRLSTTPGGDT